MRNGQDLRIGVSRDVLLTSWLLVQRVLGDGAALEPCAGAGKRDQVGCVERAPPGVCGRDDLAARGGWLRTRASPRSLSTANRPPSRPR
jgi:hypothetical protein